MYYENALGFIYTDYTLGPVFDGTNLSSTLKVKDALAFQANHPNFEEYEILLYGKPFKFKFPSSPLTSPSSDSSSSPHSTEYISGTTDISFKLYDKLLSLASYGYISDFVLGMWKEIISTYEVRETVPPTDSPSSSPLKPQRYLVKRETSTDSSLNDLASQATILMAKEALLGIYNPDSLNLNGTSISISKDYEFPDPRTTQHPPTSSSTLTTLKFKNNFSAGLRSALLSKMLESWNSDPKHVNFQRHSLLQTWQIDALKRMEHKTVILAPRRSGKSLFLALVALTHLLCYNHKKGIRPRTILYLSKDTATYKTVIDYMDATIANLDFLKPFFYYNTKDAIYYFRDPTTKEVFSQIKFLTAEGRTPGVGSAADVVIVDEAMMIKESIFRKLEPIVTHEGASLLVASTFYDTLEDGERVYDRPVRLCNEYEQTSSKILDIDNHVLSQYDDFINLGISPAQSQAGLRYTIDDVDVILGKEKIKADYAIDHDRYVKELYCRAPQKASVFNYKPHVAQTSFDQTTKTYTLTTSHSPTPVMASSYYDLLVLAYDPARTKDMSALVFLGYSKARNKISVVKEMQLNFSDKSSFIPQAQVIKEQIEWAKTQARSVVFTMDSSHPGVADVLIGQGIQIFKGYKWSGGSVFRKGNAQYEYNVPKKLMIEALQFLLDNSLMEIWDTVPMLIQQLGHFSQIYNPSTNTYTYEGVNDHDDFVAATMVGAFTIYEFFDFKYLNKDLRPNTISTTPSTTRLSPSSPQQKPLTTTKFGLSMSFIY